MNTSSVRNSSAGIGTSVTFTCTCCHETRTGTPRTYVHLDGRRFLVCKSCWCRLDYLTTHLSVVYGSAMAFLTGLRGDL